MAALSELWEGFEEALMLQFSDVQEFDGRRNNFSLYFHLCLQGREAYQKRPSFLRFQEQYPDKTARLMQLVAEADDHVFGTEPSDAQLLQELYEAYRLMSCLVSVHDPFVIKADGTVDEAFLIR